MVRSFHRCSRGAFTLVEMLIAMVLTLILVTAIAQFYAIVGDSVKDGRAMIEMGSQMRAATQRLKADLDLITVSVIPWTDDGSASGYFEYFEGIANDYNANGNFNAGSPVPDSTEGLTNLGVTNMVGDGDDFIAFTIRSSGQPFNGRYTSPTGVTPAIITSQTNPALANAAIITSQLAEVAWWVGFDDLVPPAGTANLTWDFDEPRQIYRRQLLIRPDLGQIGLDYGNTTAEWLRAHQDLMRFWQYNDVSASVRSEFNSAGTLVYRIRANSLAELCRREYRFAHMPIQITTAGTPPHLVDQAYFPHSAVTPAINPSNIALLLPCFSARSPNVGVLNSYSLQAPAGAQGESPGEDIVLSNVLAFDVQVYDPYARIWPDSIASPSTALVPSDYGYSYPPTTRTAANLLGLGAFVDLNYYRYSTPAVLTADNNLFTGSGIPLPYFAGPPSPPPYLTPAQQTLYAINFGYNNTAPYLMGATYDTWALSYERDGIDQSGNGTFDQQTNGLDDDNLNGVDDANERDTIPPYSQPLRGLQVKIRLYEPSTRQVRQATVGTDFITE